MLALFTVCETRWPTALLWGSKGEQHTPPPRERRISSTLDPKTEEPIQQKEVP